MNYKDEIKMTKALEPYMIKCKCGHTFPILNHNKRAICNWCGSMNYLDKEMQDKEQKRKEFKNKLGRILNGRTIY